MIFSLFLARKFNWKPQPLADFNGGISMSKDKKIFIKRNAAVAYASVVKLNNYRVVNALHNCTNQRFSCLLYVEAAALAIFHIYLIITASCVLSQFSLHPSLKLSFLTRSEYIIRDVYFLNIILMQTHECDFSSFYRFSNLMFILLRCLIQ